MAHDVAKWDSAEGGSAAPQPQTPSGFAVLTTKILAIGRVTAPGTPGAIAPILPLEVRDTVRLCLAERIDQWFFQTEGGGVVFILNVTDRVEAHALLEDLSLGQAGMMEFEIIPLGPLKPLGLLLSEHPGPEWRGSRVSHSEGGVT